MITDPIGDMVARIKNGYMARHKVVVVPYSKLKLQLGTLLVDEKYLAAVEVEGEKPAEKLIKLKLKYDRKDSVIRDIKRVSKPGLRVYKQSKELRSPLSGLGMAVVSTSKGIMSVKGAKEKKLGGEVLLEVW